MVICGGTLSHVRAESARLDCAFAQHGRSSLLGGGLGENVCQRRLDGWSSISLE